MARWDVACISDGRKNEFGGNELGRSLLHDLQQDQTLERIVSKSERTYRNYIAGRWVDAADGRRLEILDPSDGSHLADIARSGSEDIERAVQAARTALAGDWGRMSATDRGRTGKRSGRRSPAGPAAGLPPRGEQGHGPGRFRGGGGPAGSGSSR